MAAGGPDFCWYGNNINTWFTIMETSAFGYVEAQKALGWVY